MHDIGTYEKGDIMITITPGDLNIAKDFKQNETKKTLILYQTSQIQFIHILNNVHKFIVLTAFLFSEQSKLTDAMFELTENNGLQICEYELFQITESRQYCFFTTQAEPQLLLFSGISRKLDSSAHSD